MPPITDSDWAALDGRVSTLEGSVRYLESSQVNVVEQLAEITVAQHRAEVQRQQQAQRMDELQQALNANTDVTMRTLQAAEAVRDVVTTARMGGRFVRWLAPTLVAVGVALGVVKGWWLAGIESVSPSSIQPPK